MRRACTRGEGLPLGLGFGRQAGSSLRACGRGCAAAMWNVGWFYRQVALTHHDKKSYEALLFTGD